MKFIGLNQEGLPIYFERHIQRDDYYVGKLMTTNGCGDTIVSYVTKKAFDEANHLGFILFANTPIRIRYLVKDRQKTFELYTRTAEGIPD